MRHELVEAFDADLFLKFEPCLIQFASSRRIAAETSKEHILDEVGIGKRHAASIQNVKQPIGGLPRCGRHKHDINLAEQKIGK